MDINRNRKVVFPDLTDEQAALRFQLFDWLKSQNLTVKVAISLLNPTVSEIQRTAMDQKL